MIDGIKLNKEKQDSKLDKAFKGLSDHEAKILDSVLANDKYRLKVSNNLTPTPAIVAKLPDIYSQGFLMIYNQLEELLGKSKGSGDRPTIDRGLGAVFQRVGIGMQELGKGFELIGTGLAAMGNTQVLAGLGVATLALGAIGAFVAGLSWLESKGTGLGQLLEGIITGIGTGIATFVSLILDALSDNSELIEMLLDSLLDAFRELGPILEASAPIIVGALDEVGQALDSLFSNLGNIIDAITNFAVQLTETLFASVTETIERLAQVDGKNLLLVAGGVGAIGAALAVFAAGSVIEGVTGFFTSEGLIEKLSTFAELGPGLSLAGSGLRDLAEGVKELATANWKSAFGISNREINLMVDFVKGFDNEEFRNAVRNLEGVLPAFDMFAQAMANVALGVESLADLDDRKYNKALGRINELVSLSKEVGVNFEGMMNGILPEKPVKLVEDAVFTLDSADAGGAYFNTNGGLVQTSQDDNLTVIASTNAPQGSNGIQEFASQITEDFNKLMSKLDSYVETIANKEPDITVVPREVVKQASTDMSALLNVG